MKNTPQDLLETTLKNPTGFLDRVPTIFDYVQGLETGVVYEELNPSGDWSEYAPTPERQFNKKGDYLACVAFSHLNVREMRFNYKLKNDLFSDEAKKFLEDNGFIDENGKVNFSDRYIAKLSNTDLFKGNYLPNVADTVRKVGLIPEKLWPTTENMTWGEYYAPVPDELVKKGQEILKYFDFMYEWVDINLSLIDEPLNADTLKAMKQSPLQITIPIPSHHATSLYYATVIIPDGEKVKIFDTYDPFYFEGDKTYPIYYSMKLVEVEKKPETVPEPPHYTFNRTLRMGTSGEDVKALQTILKYLGYYNIAIDIYFGPRTKAGLQKYQLANGLKPDGIAGPITNGKLNEQYGTKKKALE